MEMVERILLLRTKRIQPARGWCVIVGGIVGGNTV